MTDMFTVYEYELGRDTELVWEEICMVGDSRVTYRLYRSTVIDDGNAREAYSFAVANDAGESELLFDIAQSEIEARGLFDDFSRGTVLPCTLVEVYHEYNADI